MLSLGYNMNANYHATFKDGTDETQYVVPCPVLLKAQVNDCEVLLAFEMVLNLAVCYRCVPVGESNDTCHAHSGPTNTPHTVYTAENHCVHTLNKCYKMVRKVSHNLLNYSQIHPKSTDLV